MYFRPPMLFDQKRRRGPRSLGNVNFDKKAALKKDIRWRGDRVFSKSCTNRTTLTYPFIGAWCLIATTITKFLISSFHYLKHFITQKYLHIQKLDTKHSVPGAVNDFT